MARPKQESHERIVRAAARHIRRHGYAGLGVAQVMKEAGLTHGGFYAHFPSRDALLAEAAHCAGGESVESFEKALAGAKPGGELAAIVAHYLSDRHVEASDRGCALAMAGSELARQPAAVRRASTQRIRDLLAVVERALPKKRQSPETAMAALSTMVGALMLARSVDDAKLSKDIRAAAAKLMGIK